MLFDRVYYLIVGKKGESKGVKISGLKITFDIKKTAKKNPNSGKITVWNLAPTTRANFDQPNTRVALYAGYGDDIGPVLIFQGNVTHVDIERDGADIKTNFELGDGHQEIRDSAVSVGYAEGVTSKQIIQDTAKNMDLPLSMPDDVPEREWKNGFSFYGSSRDLMDKATGASGSEWSIQNGTMQVIEHRGVTSRQGIIISSRSGMVKSPVRVRQAKVQKAGDKTEVIPEGESDEGWKVTTLLMPSINPGDRVILESLTANGVFRVQDIQHKGDSHGGDWQSDMTLINPNKQLDPKTGKPVVQTKDGKKKKGDKKK
jgi:hypothetical protein